MVKKRTSTAGNSVNVVLEKAEEIRKRDSVLQVPEETLQSIKSAQQIREEAQEQREKALIESNKDYYKNKVYFYGGLFGTILVLWLGFRYFKSKKPPAFLVEELVNSVVAIPK